MLLMHYHGGTEKWEIKNSYAGYFIQNCNMVTWAEWSSNDVEYSENVVVMNSNDMTQSMELHMIITWFHTQS